MTERAEIEHKLKDLLSSAVRPFPKAGKSLEAPKKGGVYIIYSPSGVVLHVGRTPSGAGGIAKRLRDHLYNQSSFSNSYLKRNGARLRRGYGFRVLIVTNRRKRALLEYLAIGLLCPKHLGLAKRKGEERKNARR